MNDGLKRRTKSRLKAWELAADGRRVIREYKNGEHILIMSGDGSTIVTTSKAEEQAAQMALEIADNRLLGVLCI